MPKRFQRPTAPRKRTKFATSLVPSAVSARRRINYNARRRSPQSYVMGSPAASLSDTRRATLKWTQTGSLTSPVGPGLVHASFRANGIKQIVQGGPQALYPLGYTEYSNLFAKYHVISAKATVTLLGPPTNAAGGGSAASVGNLGIYTSPASNPTYTTGNGFIMANKGSWMGVSDQSDSKSVTSRMVSKAFFNVANMKDNSRLSALFSDDPVDLSFFNVWYETTSGTTSTVCNFRITIEYMCEFKESKDLAPTQWAAVEDPIFVA
jgi:hypothetical protein